MDLWGICGPMMPTTSPRLTSKETSFNAHIELDCGFRPSEVCSALHGPGIAEFGVAIGSMGCLVFSGFC